MVVVDDGCHERLRGLAEEIALFVFRVLGAFAQIRLGEVGAECAVDERELNRLDLPVRNREAADDRLQIEVELLADAAAQVFAHAAVPRGVELVIAITVAPYASYGRRHGLADNPPSGDGQVR